MMFPFTTLLVPLEIARAYTEAFLPGPYLFAPKVPTQQANPPNGGVAVPIETLPSGNPVSSDQSTNSAKPMSTQFYDTQVTTVYFQILFTKRNQEAILHKDTVLVTSAMAGSGFASWQVSLFVQRLAKDGIAKPVGWTDDQAVELAEKVYPDAPPVEKIIGLKPENLKYLQLDHQVISTFDRKPARYDAEQVDVLREIAAAIKNRN
jgi:hypothetical protein